MAYSCPTTDVSRYHVDTAVPKFIADLVSGLPIKVPVEPAAPATVYGRLVIGDLHIAFACKSRAQFVEAFEVVRMEDLSGRTYDTLVEIEKALVRCKQVAATVGRDLFSKPQRVTNMPIYRNPARG